MSILFLMNINKTHKCIDKYSERRYNIKNIIFYELPFNAKNKFYLNLNKINLLYPMKKYNIKLHNLSIN